MFKSIYTKSISRLVQSFNKFSISHTSSHKVVGSIEEALDGLKSGHTILVGGFAICGIPENTIRYLATKPEIKDLTMITCTCGMFPNIYSNLNKKIKLNFFFLAVPTHGSGILITSGQVKKVITCYTGENVLLENKYINGEISMEFVPQVKIYLEFSFINKNKNFREALSRKLDVQLWVSLLFMLLLVWALM